MNSLEEVPFQTPLGSLEEPLREMELVTAPDISVPNCLQILRDTEYDFTLENWVLTGLQYGYHQETLPVPQAHSCGNPPSCPPYWLVFSSPQESRWARRWSNDLWTSTPRPRTHSLSSVDTRRLHHSSVNFLISDLDDEAGYSEDDEGSSSEDKTCHPSRGRERLRNTASKGPLSRVKELHNFGPSSHLSNHGSPRSRGHHSGASLQECRQAPLSTLEQSQPTSLLCYGQRQCRKRQNSPGSMGRQNTLMSQTSCPSPSRRQQARPSSAGPVVKNHRQRTRRTASSHGCFFDSSAELLSALSQEERELLEAITEQGYPLRTAILALQKTGYCSPEKILSYLVASDHLCEMGYDEEQVEEALEMFQNCESKAAEFLRLLTQFNEMGFQQSAIKEVLLIHENHRERALEELMTRMA